LFFMEMALEQLEKFMMACLELARDAGSVDEVPIGAVVVRNGEIIGIGRNNREEMQSVLGHAEIRAIEEASRRLGSWRLNDCVLVTTLEPCVMCAGAIVQSRIATLVYGADDPKGGGQTLFSILNSEKLNHRVNVVSGIMAEECSVMLKEFFKRKRES
jgi:tRNA(adenine34) deaminase